MNKHILLVDDEEDIVQFLGSFLRRFKIPSIIATSGEQALRLYDKEKVGFVFLDIQLGGMDGMEVFKELKNRNPEVKVIMITGKDEETYQEKAKSMGVVDYITKPLDLGDLKEKIDKYILS